jgi:hypothetical protein
MNEKSTGVKHSTVNHMERNMVGVEEEGGNSSGYEELDPEVDDVEDGYTPFVLGFKEERETTKLQICLEFSRKNGYQKESLNDAVLAGPKLQNSILRILLLFRLNPLAISADVSKMFLSGGMAEQDQKWHRIHIDGNDYQFNNWPFGNAAGPFAALFTMAKLANNLGKSDLTKWIIENCLYMDDVLASVKTKQEAITIYEELIEVYDRALLLFRKWCTNDSEILEKIPVKHRSKGFDFNDNDESLNVTMLGMSWEAKQDVLRLKGRLEPPERITMRAIISTISKIYDPLGMEDPVTITGRMIGQSLWGFVKTLKTDWDTVLDNREEEEVQAVMREWEKHFIQLTQLSQLEMSRALTDGSQKSYTIHIFGDGSKLAYAVVAYIRVVYNDRVKVKFICAKKRNVPLRGRTIPQIELMAATIVTRLKVDQKP